MTDSPPQERDAPPPPKRAPSGRASWAAFGWAFLIHAIGGSVFLFVATQVSMMFLLVPGLVQLAYVAPASVLLRAKGRADINFMLLILAAIVFLLNAGCFGLIFVGGPLLH